MAQKLFNTTKNSTVVEQLKIASGMFERMKGLLGLKVMPKDTALWIEDCNSIHTFFMNFNIDVVFIDKGMKVKKVYTNLPPWRLVLPVWKAESVIEFEGGHLKPGAVEIGDQLNVGH